jgi:hypothetical protein
VVGVALASATPAVASPRKQGFGTVGVDLHHWERRSLVARVVLSAADGDDGTATQATLTIGLDIFGITQAR